jgi:murein hydrolase activator
MQVRRPPLLVLLQPGSIEDAVHLRAVLASVGEQVSIKTAALRRAVARSQALAREAARLAARREAIRASLEARHSDLAAMAAAEALKARRAAGAASSEAERALALSEQARSLPALVRRLEGAAPMDRRTPPAAASAQGLRPAAYRMPVAGALAQPAAGAGRGVEIVPRPGALVVAPGAGRVAFAGPYRGYGTIVIIEHGGGWTSLVTGLARAQVAIGQELVAGSPLGRASAASPRIGLELRRNGQRVNPLDGMP